MTDILGPRRLTNPADERAWNETTLIQISLAQLKAYRFEEAFAQCFDELRLLAHTAKTPGFLVGLIDPDGALASAQVVNPLRGENQPPVFFSVGRHSHANLRSSADEALALRHLAVRIGWEREALTTRVFDLNTAQGFFLDGFGHCHGVTSDGPVFLRCGQSKVVLIPIDPEHPWPTSPAAAWRSLPQRRFEDLRGPEQRSALAAHGLHWAGGSAARARVTVSAVVDAPLSAIHVLGVDQPPPAAAALCLTIARPGASMRYYATRAELERGVILGRYERCDIGVEGFARPDAISRVHGLVSLLAGDVLTYLDVGSSFGSYVDGTKVDFVVLGTRTQLELADPRNRLVLERMA